MKTGTTIAVSILLIGASTQAATIAHYEFDGTGTAAVGSTITDSVGGHHGTVVGGDLLFGSDPNIGSYLTFAADGPSVGGLGNRVEVPGAPAFTFGVDGTFTIETIFRTTQTVTNGVLVSKGGDVSNPDSQWWLRHRGDGRVQGLIEGLDSTAEESASSVTGVRYDDGQWHHMAVVYNGTLATKRLDLFVDGVWIAADTTINTLGVVGGADTDPVIFGEFASLAANRSFAGDIAAIRFSDTALVPLDFLVVPEPSSGLLLLGGVFGFLRFIRRKK